MYFQISFYGYRFIPCVSFSMPMNKGTQDFSTLLEMTRGRIITSQKMKEVQSLSCVFLWQIYKYYLKLTSFP